MSAHTKGPWTLRWPGPDVVGPDGSLVASLVWEHEQDNIEAIARLMAAAPDLLEALEQALAESGCDGDLCMHRWHDSARAAVAKARGQ